MAYNNKATLTRKTAQWRSHFCLTGILQLIGCAENIEQVKNDFSRHKMINGKYDIKDFVCREEMHALGSKRFLRVFR